MTMGMTHMRRSTTCPGPRAWIPAAALAALLLAGCSSGHVSEDWQCPLAAGGSCASVAAADPAVPKPAVARRGATGEPIRLLPLESRMDGSGTPPDRGDTPSIETRSCTLDCGFDPFAWLARLLGAKTETDGKHPAEPDPAALPAEAAQAEDRPIDNDDLAADTLRTGEQVARIWIAPFVDADGIYREASHVRVVLEPAGWRLPR
ncbi:MAG: TraV family lipoprotein [Rhodospirillaceae bacterium]|nr:TraV family lipoprotein [Rhodospirillaceae bacterium]